MNAISHQACCAADDDRVLRRGSVRQLVGTMSFADSVFPLLIDSHTLAPAYGAAGDAAKLS